MPLQPELDIWIRNAEDRWFSALGQYLEEVFSDTFLPSHDHTHHLRVWNIARSLLEHISTFNKHLDPSLVEGLIIAVMFHDAGMVVTREKEHGRISRERCESFFRDRKLQRPERFEEVLEAIEKHDNKDDRIYFGITPDEPPDLLTLLSLADDLDALGVIGVYRYAEICLVRGMSMRELGVNILGNVSARFNHISKSCAMCPQILRVYREKYTYLVSFYDSYNQQLLLESDPQEVRSGYLGVVNAIRRLTLEGKTRPEDL
ncbi:MAG TPA: HD domain-containing protein, partial [Bacteroides sp.]|nr:HD domain-containing protein [Bacteroides sp.]